MWILEYQNVLLDTSDLSMHMKLPNSFRPTSAYMEVDGKPFGTCIRKTWYEYKKIPKTNFPSPENYLIWKSGKEIENSLASDFAKGGRICQSSKFFFPIPDTDLMINGECDFFIEKTWEGWDGKSKPEIVGLEIKSFGPGMRTSIMGSYKFKQSPKPNISNLFQVMMYLWAYRNRGVNEFYILYFGRADMCRKAFRIRLVEQDGEIYPEVMDENMRPQIWGEFPISKLFEGYKMINETLKLDTPPKRCHSPYYPGLTKDELLSMQFLKKTDRELIMKNKRVESTCDVFCGNCAWHAECCKDIKTLSDEEFFNKEIKTKKKKEKVIEVEEDDLFL